MWLHLPQLPRLSREYFAMLMLEDAGHYLFFSVMTLTSAVPPSLPNVAPCVIFAFFRFSVYLRELLHTFMAETNPVTTLLKKLDGYSSAAFGLAANQEIFGFVRVIIVALMFACISGLRGSLVPGSGP